MRRLPGPLSPFITGLTPGTVGSASLIPIITYDQRGRILAVSTAAAASGPGWGFKSYATATAASSISIGSLDLNTDLAYQFIVQVTQMSALDNVSMRVNNNSDGDYSSNYAHDAGAGPTTVSATSVTFMEMSPTGGAFGDCFNALVSLGLARDGRPMMHQSASWGTSTSIKLVDGGGLKNATTNVTSAQFLTTGATCNWRVWCFVAKQS